MQLKCQNVITVSDLKRALTSSRQFLKITSFSQRIIFLALKTLYWIISPSVQYTTTDEIYRIKNIPYELPKGTMKVKERALE